MTHTRKSKVSLVIPVYNEEGNLEELNKRILDVFHTIDIDYEIIYVDDGSIDKSLSIINKLSDQNEFIRFISFFRNFGQHASVMAGFKNAEGDIVITLDSDLQNPPEAIPEFLNAIEKGYDIVAGRRVKRKDYWIRTILSFIMNKIISLLIGSKLHDHGCMMRAYRRPIVEQVLKYGEKSVYIPAFASWLTSNTIEIPIKHYVRKGGKTRYSFFKLLGQAFDLITAYTLIPIQIISLVGVTLSLLGVILFGYLMYYRLFFGSPSSLTTFIAFLVLLSGITLFSLGVISEYIARLYREVRKTPLYIIKNRKE